MQRHVSEHARQVSRSLDTVRVQTKLTNRLGHRDSPSISAFEDAPIESPRDCPAAEKWYAEANAFFFRESQNLNSTLRRFRIEPFDQAQSQHDAEHAIECAGAGNGIQMRTYQEPRCARLRALK